MPRPLNIPKTTLLANDTGRDIAIVSVSPVSDLGGTVQVSGTNVVYTPPALTDYGQVKDRFHYTAEASGQRASANVVVTLTSVVDARDDTLPEMNCGTSSAIAASTLLANDFGTDLIVSEVSPAVYGNTALDGNAVTYTAPDCLPVLDPKTVITKKRFVRGGPTTTDGLLKNANNPATLEIGDLIVMTSMKTSNTTIEAGWVTLSASSQAKIHYRWVDQEYLTKQSDPQYRGDTANPYPYFVGSSGIDPHALIRVFSFRPIPGLNPSELILDYSTFTGNSAYTFARPVQNDDHYRNNFIIAWGADGEYAETGAPPQTLTDTVAQTSVWDRVGNKYTLEIEGDAPGQQFSSTERAVISNASAIYAMSFSLREVPVIPQPVTEDRFVYTARDPWGVEGQATVRIPINSPVRLYADRFRQVGYLANENGECGVSNSMIVGSYMLAIFTKSVENTTGPGNPENPDFPARGNNPSDPLPGWTVVAKSPPHSRVATTIAYRRFDEAYRSEVNGSRVTIKAFPNHRDFNGTTTIMGIEIGANLDETWRDLYINCVADARDVGQYEYPEPLYTPENTFYLDASVTRPYTTEVAAVGDGAQIVFDNQDNYRNRHATLAIGNAPISMEYGYPDAGTLDNPNNLSQVRLVLRKRPAV